jgi:hypothetical protein
MRDADIGAFYALLDDVATLLARPGQPAMTPTAKAMFFRALQGYSLEAVRAALDAHVKDPQRGRFMPLPADVIAQLQGAAADDGRPGPEEAWAIALRSHDEADTVVWTEEIAQARAIARPLLDAGDEVGARMAFKEAYSRLVAEARSTCKPAAWSASLGFDPRLRRVALEAAVQAHRLPASDAYQLSGPASPPVLLLGQAMGAPPHVIASLRALADKIRAQADAPSADVLAKADTQQRQAETAERVERYAAARGLSA